MSGPILRLLAGIYRASLAGYPREFRRRHGAEMQVHFEDELRIAAESGPLAGLGCLLRVVADWAPSVARERWTAVPAAERLACGGVDA